LVLEGPGMKLSRISPFMLIFLTGCSSTAGEVKPELSSGEEFCTLAIAGDKKILNLTPPCELVLINHLEVDYYRYGEKNVYLVAGKPAAMAELKKWPVIAEDLCSLEMQAVIVSDKNIALSTVTTGALVCPKKGLDEIFYRSVMRKKI